VRRMLARLRRRGLEQGGYIAIVTAITVPTVFLGCAAVAVDTANWYANERDMQKAADAAALAGVPYLPYDFTSAKARALAVAKFNGYTPDSDTTVTVSLGARDTQLKVTITDHVGNAFGKFIGVPNAYLSRSATADYQGPQPMGSPCNTFGNEPTSGTAGSSPTPAGTAKGTTPFPNCTTAPQFWGNIEGPQTGKLQGDEYQTKNCENKTHTIDGCAGNTNSEYLEFGYVFVVKVQAAAVNTPVKLQLYDPEFANTSSDCNFLPDSTDSLWSGSGNANPYVTKADAKNRYSDDGTTFKTFCTGDQFPRTDTSISSTPSPVTTSFVLRQQNDSQDPTKAPVQSDTGGSPCIKQYAGYTPNYTSGSPNFPWSSKTLTSGQTGYNAELASVFHNWTSFCTFTPKAAGDYYLQVRSNVSLGGTCTGTTFKICSGNTAAAADTGNTVTGEGSNAFAIRAVTNAGLETSVAVAGYSHMPISINADTATGTFNLIRVLPGAAGHFIQFSYFDAGDSSSSSGQVKVLVPADATGTIKSTPFPGGGCTAIGGSAGASTVTLSNCTAPFVSAGSESKNNGKSETITIPIPSDYSCNYSSFGGCWYQVQIGFGTGAVHDVTTWNATVVGDPVRLIK
jgi:hypothetical protein